MKLLSATLLAALAIGQVEAYPKFFTGMTWANFAWEVNPKEEDLAKKDMVLVDAFDASSDSIKRLKGQSGNAKIVCYLSAGTWESWRPDQNKFPEHLKKENYYSGSSREKWLDITKWGELKSIMQSRMSMAKSKGCDAIEFDNQDCYINGGSCMKGPSYATLKSNQVSYAQWLADAAHSANLAVGLKNAMEIMDTLKGKYDFAINEECAQYGECGIYKAFSSQGKAVFGVEYNGQGHCDDAEKQGISRKYKTSSGHWQDCDWMAKSSSGSKKKQEAEDADSGPNVGAIIGGIVGGLACVALVVGGGFFAYKKKKAQGEMYNHMVESTTSML